MKLIIKEYLASLNERGELEVVLTNLLSKMGLNVFSKPGRGSKQSGVDVAAYGSIENQPNKTYLFSIKSGNLDRRSWNGSGENSLRPSLDEILDDYIPHNLPPMYQNEPIQICLCFGGDLSENARSAVSGYQQLNTKNNISFEEWNGEVLSNYIEKHFLQEHLLPKDCHDLLRKSLALVGTPEESYKYFTSLVIELINDQTNKETETLDKIRQLYLCLGILFSWCKNENNYESACLSSEFVILHVWDKVKEYMNKKRQSKTIKNINSLFSSIMLLTCGINYLFLEEKIIPHTHKFLGLSNAVRSGCYLDVNLKLFELLGRLSLYGLWHVYWLNYLSKKNNKDETVNILNTKLEAYQQSIVNLIHNNPVLISPYKDDQAIDIILTMFFLSLFGTKNKAFIHEWLVDIIGSTGFAFEQNLPYPCTLDDYEKLVEHPRDKTQQYKESVTQGSILYPYLAIMATQFNFDDVYQSLAKIQKDFLPHCNFQVWFINASSEVNFYNNNAQHGSILSPIDIQQDKQELLDKVFSLCEKRQYFNELSAIKFGLYPIILTACRHYRVPIAPEFFKLLPK